MSKNQSRLAGLTEEETMAQMELIRGKGRDLLTDDERSSWHNISHNSDNGYLYQDADFLCGAIIKLRASEARKKKLLERSHSFIKWLNEQTAWQTMSPHRDIGTLVKAIAAELKGE